MRSKKANIVITGSIPSKKNSKRWIVRGNRKFLVPSENHEKWHSGALWQLKSCKDKFSVCSIKAVFYFPTKHKKDLSNAWESLGDLLVDAGILEDDNCFVVHDLRLVFGGVSPMHPRAEIEILSS